MFWVVEVLVTGTRDEVVVLELEVVVELEDTVEVLVEVVRKRVVDDVGTVELVTEKENPPTAPCPGINVVVVVAPVSGGSPIAVLEGVTIVAMASGGGAWDSRSYF